MTRIVLAAALLAAFSAFAGPAGASAPAPQPERAFDNPARCSIAYHAIEAVLDPATATLTATDRLTLRHASGVSAEAKVPLLLHRGLQVRDIRVADEGGPRLQWEESPRWNPRDFWERPEYAELAGLSHGRQIDLTLAAPSAAVWPESLVVVVRYAGVVYDSLRPPPENYQRGFETTTGLIDPRGAYLSGTSLWYPQRFDDPCPFRLDVTVPPGWQAVSQGERLDGEAEQRVTWISTAPMDEIYLVAGPYVLREEAHPGPTGAGRPIAIQTFTYGNDDEALVRTYLDATHDYLDLYSRRIGPYPFPKFALVENFWQTGYGMPGFTLLGDRVIRLPFIVHTSYGHEILHNWWGNGVFVDYEGGNWCEGLTVYGADYLYKERESPAAARDYRRAQLVEYRNYVRAGRDFPLTEFRERHDASSAAIGYGKSMMLYHMVRGELGEERFWNCLARFYDGHLFHRASWSDVLAAFAADAPFDRAAFYDQWIARAGAPALRLSATDLLPQPNGTYELAYVLEQETPLYSLTVPMRVTYADRPADNWTVRLEEGTLRGTRSLAGMPRALEVDPDFDLFRRLHPAEVPAVLSRIFGADSMTFAIAGEESAEVREAFRAVAGEAGATRPEAVLDAGTISPGDLTAGGSWILGEPRWMDRLRPLLPDGFLIEPDGFRVEGVLHERAKSTLVLALPNPQLPEEAIGLVLSGEAQAVPAVWRKLPHYGKYSYLVFHGTENVAKGIWEADRSPLKVVWEEGS